MQVYSCPRSTIGTHFVPRKLPPRVPLSNRCHARTPSRVIAMRLSLPGSVIIRERLVFFFKRSLFASTYLPEQLPSAQKKPAHRLCHLQLKDQPTHPTNQRLLASATPGGKTGVIDDRVPAE